MNSEQMLSCLSENDAKGIIFVSDDGRISRINSRAEKILGISLECMENHPAGVLCKGDIVVIADTQIGRDDGKLTPEDLKALNICDKEIKENCVFVGMGVYGDEAAKPLYKYSKNLFLSEPFAIEENYLGHHIKAFIDDETRTIEICVDDERFSHSYIDSYGHLVIIDGATGRVKFFQDKGYSIRRECVSNVLRGEPFRAKGDGRTDDVVGRRFEDIIEIDHIGDRVENILSGKEDDFDNAVYDVNKRSLLLSMHGVRDGGKIVGVMIKLIELDKLTSLLSERDEVIRVMESEERSRFRRASRMPENVFDSIVGQSFGMREAKQLAYKVAKRNCSVLITGESGTGKSLLAREIYLASGDRGPYVSVDCSTISPSLFESEMFGYVGGAFTGASTKGKAGFFEIASGGTIFLDEIGEIPLEIQAKLLSVLQNKEIYRVGSTKPVPVSVRVIAATNRDLEEEVSAGRFRRDLYYRLSVFTLEMPPLRYCKEDIYYLTRFFLEKKCAEQNVERKVLSEDSYEKLFGYSWPGNIRELQNTIERAIALCDDKIIFSEYISLPKPQRQTSLKDMLKGEERAILERALAECGGDKKKVMERLALSKSVLYAKLKEYELDK